MDADTALTVVCLPEKLVGFGHAVQVRGLARLAALRPTCDPCGGSTSTPRRSRYGHVNWTIA